MSLGIPSVSFPMFAVLAIALGIVLPCDCREVADFSINVTRANASLRNATTATTRAMPTAANTTTRVLATTTRTAQTTIAPQVDCLTMCGPTDWTVLWIFLGVVAGIVVLLWLVGIVIVFVASRHQGIPLFGLAPLPPPPSTIVTAVPPYGGLTVNPTGATQHVTVVVAALEAPAPSVDGVRAPNPAFPSAVESPPQFVIPRSAAASVPRAAMASGQSDYVHGTPMHELPYGRASYAPPTS